MLLRGFGGIVYKEIIQVMRDPASLVLTIIMPLVQLTIYGYAIDTEVKNVATMVLDQDRTPASRDFVQRLEATGLYTVHDYVFSAEELNAAIVADDAKVGINIPAGYQRDLNGGDRATIQVLIDGSNNTVAGQTLSTVQNIGFQVSAEILQADRAGPLPLDVRPRLLFNPSLRSANFFVPGLIGILLFIVTMQLTAFGIVREREIGTLEQLMVTPVSRGALMLGKVLPYMVLGMLQMLIIILFAQLLFDVHIAGNLYLLIGLAWIFVFSSLGLGLIISTIARTQLQAMMMSFLLMLPSILLSGFIFPRESMPLPIYVVSSILPATYFIDILRGIILRGAGIEALWDEALVLVVMGVVLISIAIFRFHKTVG
jgi:ABC-type multidrug transport system permease subunit